MSLASYLVEEYCALKENSFVLFRHQGSCRQGYRVFQQLISLYDKGQGNCTAAIKKSILAFTWQEYKIQTKNVSVYLVKQGFICQDIFIPQCSSNSRF